MGKWKRPKDIPEGMSFCRDCEQIKPLSDFNKSSKRGVQSYCRSCMKKNNATPLYRARRDQYRSDNYENVVLPARKVSLAKRRDALSNRGSFTSAEFRRLFESIGSCCSYCRKPLTMSIVTADHIQPLSKGGNNDIDNIAPACMECNTKKNNSTDPKWTPFWKI